MDIHLIVQIGEHAEDLIAVAFIDEPVLVESGRVRIVDGACSNLKRARRPSFVHRESRDMGPQISKRSVSAPSARTAKAEDSDPDILALPMAAEICVSGRQER